MNRKSYEVKMKMIVVTYAAVMMITAFLVYLFLKDIFITVVAVLVMTMLATLTYLTHLLDDKYISGIVDDLSRLTDMLMELEEKEIFAENEDTMLSKLQSKVIKLTGILKRKNEISQKEKENIKTLVSDISHQLKTPISNLKIYVNFLKDESLPEEKRREYVEIARLAVDRLNDLSESMIKISRLESGLIHLDMQEQSLNETVLKAVKDVYVNAKNNNHEIIYSEEEEIVICHDRKWTSEAVFNLLDNAVKYAKEGGRIYLTIRKYGKFCAIEVKDENEVIGEEERTKIFSRFYRGKNAGNKEGIGVGLYLAREITVRQGGYMNLKSYDNGNIFSIML